MKYKHRKKSCTKEETKKKDKKIINIAFSVKVERIERKKICNN